MGPLILWSAIVVAVVLIKKLVLAREPDESVCAACGYSRIGLAPGSVCPECGTCAGPTAAASGCDNGRAGAVSSRLILFSFAILVLIAMSPQVLALISDLAEAKLLIARGYRADVAWRAVTMAPELGCVPRRVPPERGELYLAACLPLAGVLPGRWGWRVSIGIVAIAATIALSLWVIALVNG